MTTDLQKAIEQAQPDVSERRLARVYAEAFLNVAEKQHAVDEVLAQLHDLTSDVRRREGYVQAFFTSGVVGKERRESALKTAFDTRCHPLVLRFLLVLNDHDRLMLFRTAVQELQALHDTRQRRFSVAVRSAVPLTDEQRQRLTDNLRQVFQLEPVLDAKIDAELLGGMIIRVGDWVLDGSVRNQIIKWRKDLLEKSSHAIQSGRDRFSVAAGN